MESNRFSIVDYASMQTKGRCGYCSSKNGSLSYGLHAHVLNVEDYQNMIDRGWRRCGQYCYKSVMEKSCCPLYTIRCAAKDFKLSKTQKKIIKRFNNFLSTGVVTKEKIHKNSDIAQLMDLQYINDNKQIRNMNSLSMEKSIITVPVNEKSFKEENYDGTEAKEKLEEPIKTPPTSEKPIKNKSNKAKYQRIERKRQKLQKLGYSDEEIAKKLVEKKRYPIIKTLEDHLNEVSSKSQLLNLKISLVRSYPPSEEFKDTFAAVFDLYKRYQISIHKDRPEEITERQFERFLVISPLQALSTYGSYHQQYWLDNKLIAVGVIDILPKCVSSVYFFYDPEYSHLSLGTYGALRELEFTRKLSSRFSDLEFYYMGFYIHACPKMKYKAAFKPSYLLCPETYTWHPILDCLPKLNLNKYSRLNEDLTAIDMNSNVSPSDILILYNRTAMPLTYYLGQNDCATEEIEEIMEYAEVVGKLCLRNLLLFRM